MMNKPGRPLSLLKAVGKRVRTFIQGDPDFFLRKIKGVIHVGANSGQERELYAKNNLRVLWIEPIPEVFEKLRIAIASYPTQRAICKLITDVDDKECIFHVSNNDGASSSVLEFADHKQLWPEITYERTIILKGTTLSSLIKRESVKVEDYGGLVVDVQGAELLVLKGAVDVLPSFRFIQLEAADFEAYKHCCQLPELDSFLRDQGFRLVMKRRFAHNEGVGSYFDAVFERRLSL